MPAVISYPCPYCAHDTGGFDVVAEHITLEEDGERLYQTLAICGKCKKAVVAVFNCPRGSMTPMTHNSDYKLAFEGNKIPLELIDIEPKPTIKIAPKHLPDDVDRALKQAYAAKKLGHWEPAMIMTRKALERALKHIDPNGDKLQPLGQRIERLSKQGLVPPAMVEWAFEVTHLGNDAAHDDCISETSEEIADIEQAIEFADLFFTYTFTMVEEMRLRRERKQ